MSIQTSTAKAASLMAASLENNPVIAWNNLAAESTLGGTTPIPGGERANAVTDTTHDKWRVEGNDAGGEVDFSATFASNPIVNFAAIAAHNLGSLGGSLMLQKKGASRTNLLRYSDQFDNALWFKTKCTVTPNSAIAPNGQMVGDRITEITNNASILQSVTPPGGLANKTFTFSQTLWIDEGQPSQIRLYLYGGVSLEGIVAVDLNVTTVPTRYQVSITFGASPASTTLVSRIDPFFAAITTQSFYVAEAQLEEGPTPTSPIPTQGSAVTSDWHDLTEWSIPSDNSPVAFRFEDQSDSLAYRFRFAGISSLETLSVGVIFLGKELIIPQRFYKDFSPILTPTEVQLQVNRSVGNELLGSTVIGRGSSLSMSLEHISPLFLRGQDWLSFQRYYNEVGGFFFAWRPSKYPEDLHYCWRSSGSLRPSNSGPKDYMGFSMNVQVHNAS